MNVSNHSIEQTCSCSTCTCSNNSHNTDYLENHTDCLTYIFIIFYESSIWCLQMIYELFFQSFWQVLIYIKQELEYNQKDNKIIKNIDRISINNSSLFKTYHRKDDSSIDRNIVVISVRSSYCQTEKDVINRNTYSKQNQTISTVPYSMKEQTTSSLNERILALPTRPVVFDQQQRFKQKRRTIIDNKIPLALATSLHSNISSYNTDYFLTKYIHSLLTNKHYLR